MIRRREREREQIVEVKGKGVMDWDLRASAWDLTELGREDDTRLTALVGSSSLGGQNKKGKFSVDLKLGRLGDGSVDKSKDPRASTMGSSPSVSSKRSRAVNGTQNVSCLVDGCKSDLSNCREYHRRHRVCERHSKTPIVIVGGAEQRFCQQCSRFHSLGEFDEVKRSCRKRLDGHNRRRRKPQPESLYMSSGSFMSNHEGTRLLQFSGPQIYAPTTVCSPTWPVVAKSEEGAMLYNHHRQLHVIDRQSPFPNSFSCSYNGGDKQFSFLHDPKIGNQAAPEVSICQPLLNTIASSECGRGRQKMLSDGLTRSVASNCALSLLSTHPTQTLGISSSHLVQPGMTPPVQPLGMGLHFNCLAKYTCSQGMANEAVDPILVSDASNTDIHCNGMFHVGPDGLSEIGASRTLPSSWE